MGTGSFAEKFERALTERKQADPEFGLRTLARILAGGNPDHVETIRRRLNKYRPPKGGGAAEVAPSEPTRRDIEHAMGLEPGALEPDEDMVAALMPRHAEDMVLEALRPFARLVAQSNDPTAHLAASTAGSRRNGG